MGKGSEDQSARLANEEEEEAEGYYDDDGFWFEPAADGERRAEPSHHLQP